MGNSKGTCVFQYTAVPWWMGLLGHQSWCGRTCSRYGLSCSSTHGRSSLYHTPMYTSVVSGGWPMEPWGFSRTSPMSTIPMEYTFHFEGNGTNQTHQYFLCQKFCTPATSSFSTMFWCGVKQWSVLRSWTLDSKPCPFVRVITILHMGYAMSSKWQGKNIVKYRGQLLLLLWVHCLLDFGALYVPWLISFIRYRHHISRIHTSGDWPRL